jgi:endonuclease/exonuclease/phosphatase family metal-dependent hydrolase
VRTASPRLGAFVLYAFAISASVFGTACAITSRPDLRSFPDVLPTDLSCIAPADGVGWVRQAPASHLQTLDAWCASVGPPWVHTLETPDNTSPDTLVVVSWNMHVGRGSLDSLLEYLKATVKELGQSRVATVLMLQEVYREGTDVPESPRFRNASAGSIRPRIGDPDITQIARAHGLSAIYVPSMRNGSGARDRQDRGNAILSTEPLRTPVAIELPFGKQRRVAVAATVADVQFISTHVDPGRDRVAQAQALAQVDLPSIAGTVVAGDLNSVEGTNDGTYKALAGRYAVEACGGNRTHAWPWRMELLFGGWVGRLDHVFTTLPDGRWSKRCATIPHFFGSDHRPVVLILQRTTATSGTLAAESTIWRAR